MHLQVFRTQAISKRMLSDESGAYIVLPIPELVLDEILSLTAGVRLAHYPKETQRAALVLQYEALHLHFGGAFQQDESEESEEPEDHQEGHQEIIISQYPSQPATGFGKTLGNNASAQQVAGTQAHQLSTVRPPAQSSNAHIIVLDESPSPPGSPSTNRHQNLFELASKSATQQKNRQPIPIQLPKVTDQTPRRVPPTFDGFGAGQRPAVPKQVSPLVLPKQVANTLEAQFPKSLCRGLLAAPSPMDHTLEPSQTNAAGRSQPDPPQQEQGGPGPDPNEDILAAFRDSRNAELRPSIAGYLSYIKSQAPRPRPSEPSSNDKDVLLALKCMSTKLDNMQATTSKLAKSVARVEGLHEDTSSAVKEMSTSVTQLRVLMDGGQEEAPADDDSEEGERKFEVPIAKSLSPTHIPPARPSPHKSPNRRDTNSPIPINRPSASSPVKSPAKRSSPRKASGKGKRKVIVVTSGSEYEPESEPSPSTPRQTPKRVCTGSR